MCSPEASEAEELQDVILRQWAKVDTHSPDTCSLFCDSELHLACWDDHGVALLPYRGNPLGSPGFQLPQEGLGDRILFILNGILVVVEL